MSAAHGLHLERARMQVACGVRKHVLTYLVRCERKNRSMTIKLPSLRVVLGSLAILACLASTAFAGTTGGYRKITLLQASSSNDRVIIKFDANLSSRPSCVSAGNEDLMSFDGATARGKIHLALVQASFLSNRLVSATGTGTCTSGIENLNWIGFAD